MGFREGFLKTVPDELKLEGRLGGEQCSSNQLVKRLKRVHGAEIVTVTW